MCARRQSFEQHLDLIAVGPDPFDDELVAAVEKAVVRGKQRFPLVGYTWPASDWSPARVTAMRKLSLEEFYSDAFTFSNDPKPAS